MSLAASTPLQAKLPAGSSFYAAMRILPRLQREAMFEIYRFCRTVDDIADSDGPRAARLEQLAQWRREIAALYRGEVIAATAGLARAREHFELEQADFSAVIDGVEMDVVDDIRAPELSTLDLYCERVASAVGRLSTPVFGMPSSPGQRLAHHLGRALQLTNILRDLDKDAQNGRLYLPREALLDAGIETSDPAAALRNRAVARPCNELAKLARAHFAAADEVMADAPRKTVRAPRIMAEVYRSILDRLEQRGWTPPRHDVGVGRARIAWILLRKAIL